MNAPHGKAREDPGSSTTRAPALLGVSRASLLGALVLGAAVACSDGAGPGGLGSGLESCDLDERFIADGGVGRNGIPSLTDPPMLSAQNTGAFSYLRPDDRVVGFVVDGQAYAVPHNILWWHEIVNLNVKGRELAVTLCPLTGTSLGFDRSSIGGDELGVSGLLFKANLIMFNRGQAESLWPQMLGEARCGAEVGKVVERYPVVELTWAAWKALHPNTLAVTEDTGHRRDYQVYPYGDYESPQNSSFLGFPVPRLDPRLPPKERVIGVPPAAGQKAIAFPFGSLSGTNGPFAVVEFAWQGEPAVVLWSDDGQGGMVYRPRTTGGKTVALTVANGTITDVGTGSAWSVDGRAVSGPMVGARLVPIESAYTAFWGAWSGFFPETDLWSG